MSKIQWEYNLVERPFCEQLQRMGWSWIEGDVDVAEFKSPGIENPMHEAINQLLRYSNQRRELYPTLYADNEGVEKLFNTNQLLIASNFFEARAATIGAPPEAYLEWSDTSPVPMSTVAEELGIISASDDLEEAKGELLAVGSEQTERVGTPLFFRQPEQRPEALRSTQCATLHSQQVLTAGMLRPAHLLDLIRNITVFQQVDGKTRKVVARYQQFRAIQKATIRLQDGRTRSQGAERDERGGIIWHTQGSGKSLSMVFLVRKMRTLEGLKRYKIVTVTDRTDLEGQLRETARLSGEAVRPTDKDRGTRESSTALTQRILSETTPDIVFAMLQKYQDVDRQAKSDEKIAMTIVRKEKKPGKDEPVVEKEVTFEESIRFEEFPVLNESDEILVLVDEAHRSHTRSLHRNLRIALPNAAIIGFTGTPILSKEKTETREIFGDFIDKYLLQDAERDGATVPILYEGRTADGLVKDAPRHFQAWYQAAGAEWLNERVRLWEPKVGKAASKIVVSDLGFRWGSCGKNSVLYFNWRLIQLSVWLVDYVIAHELVHLHEQNHTPGFWRLLDRVIPDWKERKEELSRKRSEMQWCIDGG